MHTCHAVVYKSQTPECVLNIYMNTEYLSVPRWASAMLAIAAVGNCHPSVRWQKAYGAIIIYFTFCLKDTNAHAMWTYGYGVNNRLCCCATSGRGPSECKDDLSWFYHTDKTVVDCPVLIMGIPILVRRYFYIKMGPWWFSAEYGISVYGTASMAPLCRKHWLLVARSKKCANSFS